MTRKPIYQWEAKLRHEGQGFGKSATVEASTDIGALVAAKNAVASERYDADGFQVVEIKRGRIDRYEEVE